MPFAPSQPGGQLLALAGRPRCPPFMMAGALSHFGNAREARHDVTGVPGRHVASVANGPHVRDSRRSRSASIFEKTRCATVATIERSLVMSYERRFSGISPIDQA